MSRKKCLGPPPGKLSWCASGTLLLVVVNKQESYNNIITWALTNLWFSVVPNTKACGTPFVRDTSKVGLTVLGDFSGRETLAANKTYPFGTTARISCPIGYRLSSLTSSWNTTFGNTLVPFTNIRCQGSLGWQKRPFDITCTPEKSEENDVRTWASLYNCNIYMFSTDSSMAEVVGGIPHRTLPVNPLIWLTVPEGIIRCFSSFPGYGLPFLTELQQPRTSAMNTDSWKTSKFNDTFIDVLNFYAAENKTVLLGENIR